MEIEHSLRAALRPEDPGADFTAAVLARVAVEQRQRQRRARWQMPLALAASVLVTLVGLQILLHQREQDRIEMARQDLALALEITSEQLNQLQRKLNPVERKENGI